MNRNYKFDIPSTEWSRSRETDPAVAAAIHAIADTTRSPEAIWEAPTQAEWDHVHMAVEEYVRAGFVDYEADGYCWGMERVRIDQPA